MHRSPSIAALTATAVTLLLCATDARAQEPAPGPQCTYMDCALRFEGGRLVRGAAGETVARPGFFRPVRLVPHVTGDSALAFAASHDRASTRAAWLSNGGTLAMLAGFAIAMIGDRGCEPFQSGTCRDGDALHITAGVLVIGGAVANFASIPFARRAWRLQDRAVWWNNARYAR